MALPKLETPTYELSLPSTNESIKFRPFLVKEQKILYMAQNSKNDSEISNSVSQLVSNCTFNKIDPLSAPMFDIEYIFLNLRSKSVGSEIEIQFHIIYNIILCHVKLKLFFIVVDTTRLLSISLSLYYMNAF